MTPRLSSLTPSDFIKKLQSLSKDLVRLLRSRFWPRYCVDEEICIFKNKTKRYILALTNVALQHDEDAPGLGSFTLLYQPNSASVDIVPTIDPEIFEIDYDRIDYGRYRTLSMRSFVKDLDNAESLPHISAVFVALGWLVENEGFVQSGAEQTKRRTTNYVVLLNLSTKPISLWLMYDYHSMDEATEIRSNRLGRYHNRLYNRQHGEPNFIPGVQDEFAEDGDDPAHSDNFDQFRQVCLDMEDECLHPPSPTITTYEDKAIKLADEITTNVNVFIKAPRDANKDFEDACARIIEAAQTLREISHSHVENAGFQTDNDCKDRSSISNDDAWNSSASSASQQSASFKNSYINGSSSTFASTVRESGDEKNPLYSDKHDKCEKGFFGLPHLFDFALLAPDIDAWHVDGLDEKVVWKCLQSSHVRLGSSLRASSLMDDTKISAIGHHVIDLRPMTTGQNSGKSKCKLFETCG